MTGRQHLDGAKLVFTDHRAIQPGYPVAMSNISLEPTRRFPVLSTEVLWPLSGFFLVAGFALIAWISHRFGYAFEVIEMPVLPMVAGLVALGLLFLATTVLTAKMANENGRSSRAILMLMIGVGLAARLVLFGSTPILEDDYQRYLWDGAVTAHGLNPYLNVPEDAAQSSDLRLRDVAKEAGIVLERVNHPETRTIYPAAAQAFFAAAYLIKPFSLAAWRAIALLMDMATLVLILVLLRDIGRPLIWSTLYWWNPIVIKELFNSAHMEAVLMAFVLGAVWLAIRRKPWLAAIALGIGAGIKIWPIVLFPLIARVSTQRLRHAVGPAALFSGLLLLLAVPMVTAGLNQNSGIVVYAETWKTNGALFVVLHTLAESLGLEQISGVSANRIVRGLIVVLIATVGLGVAAKVPRSAKDTLLRAAVVTGAVFLLSPAQFPWYVVWIAPFLPFFFVPGFLLLSMTMPLYYIAFYLQARGTFHLFNEIVIWLVWCPVWVLLMIQAARRMAGADERP